MPVERATVSMKTEETALASDEAGPFLILRSRVAPRWNGWFATVFCVASPERFPPCILPGWLGSVSIHLGPGNIVKLGTGPLISHPNTLDSRRHSAGSHRP